MEEGAGGSSEQLEGEGRAETPIVALLRINGLVAALMLGEVCFISGDVSSLETTSKKSSAA